jgi:hypothetical protein
VVVVIVDETAGSHMLNTQNVGSVIAADSGPAIVYIAFSINIINIVLLTTIFSSTGNAYIKKR